MTRAKQNAAGTSPYPPAPDLPAAVQAAGGFALPPDKALARAGEHVRLECLKLCARPDHAPDQIIARAERLAEWVITGRTPNAPAL